MSESVSDKCSFMTKAWPAWLVAGALIAGGCTKANPAATCSDGTCSDPAFPFCDVDGSVGGEPGTCVAITCQAGANGGCQGSAALVCNANGTSFDPVPCANGCDPNAGCNACMPGAVQCSGMKLQTCGSDAVFADTETCELACTNDPTPHCAYLSPKYIPDACEVLAPGTALAIAGNATIDSSLDNNCTGGVVPQTGGPEICVMHYESISVSVGATVTLVGTRAVALVADRGLSVSGTLEVGATGTTSGPGGGVSASGGFKAPGQFGGKGGDGGAGFLTNGGAGGDFTTDGGAANGGTASGSPAAATVFAGGPHTIGGGGGALALVSCRSTVSVLGTLDSRGGGGLGGRFFVPAGQAARPWWGTGGGAGGYVVLQGANVLVTGQVFANGGGGGAGNNTALAPGNVNGLDGTASDTVCARGGIAPSGAGNGGVGGCGTFSFGAPGDGIHPSDSTNGQPGGGGGSMGFFQSYTPAGVTPTLLPAHASPGFQPNLTVETR